MNQDKELALIFKETEKIKELLGRIDGLEKNFKMLKSETKFLFKKVQDLEIDFFYLNTKIDNIEEKTKAKKHKEIKFRLVK